jgi:hypothetical protein
MTKTIEKTQKKLLVYLWEPLVGLLKEKMDGVCMKRDAYLDLVFKYEAQKLDEEVLVRNSGAAKEFIAHHLGLLKKKPVTLYLSAQTTDLLTEVCERKNTPRDAFINRVILFLLLSGKPKFKEMLYPEINWDNEGQRLIEEDYLDKYVLFEPSTLDVIAKIIQDDPFWFLRTCIGLAREFDDEIQPLHQKFLNKDCFFNGKINVLGFNCFVNDVEIESSTEYKKRQEAAERLLTELLAFSDDIDESKDQEA